MKSNKKISLDASLYTGIEEIDRQHEMFIERLNRINEHLHPGSEGNALRGAVHFMDRYARWHFSTEERYMQEYGYPEIRAHKREHERFYENTEKLMEMLENGDVDRSTILFVDRYMIDWVILHIKGTDRKFAEYLKKKGLNIPREEYRENMD